MLGVSVQRGAGARRAAQRWSATPHHVENWAQLGWFLLCGLNLQRHGRCSSSEELSAGRIENAVKLRRPIYQFLVNY